MKASYAELAVATNFSFLRGASHPEHLVATAIALGLSAIGIADRNSVAGVVRAWAFLRDNAESVPAGFRTLSGARLAFTDSTPDILAYPRDRPAWGRLCRLLTTGNRRAPKGECHLSLSDLQNWAEGLSLIVLDTADEAAQRRTVEALRAQPGAQLWIGVCPVHGRGLRAAMAKRLALAQALSLPPLAINDVLMHAPSQRELLDVLTCIREHTTLDAAGRKLSANAERQLKSPAEMARLFADAAPHALAETLRFAEGIAFSLAELKQTYPEELRAGYATPYDALEAYTWAGARTRFEGSIPDKQVATIRHELALIKELEYEAFFLTVHDIVRFAKGKGILAQGRGSAANSVVCYCLGITDVKPDMIETLFERFISRERNEPPDIDVDFEHERREDVIQHIYDHYGREHAALAASVITYRSRSSLREVGKAFGFSDDVLTALAGTVWSGYAQFSSGDVPRLGLDPTEPRLAKALALAEQIGGFPRHLSQHTGGFVITADRLDEVVPISNAAMDKRTVVEWDKDDLDALGILKVDVLALGMLTCLRKGFELLDTHYGEKVTIASVAQEDPKVYAMIQAADTIGVFQIESRAQMSMLPRLKPAKYYDLVIEVAIVRPGPIQGDMVHPYLRRRLGLEEVNYALPALEPVLRKTLGVPLFQEQAMKIAIVAAGFSPGRADQLRRAMATFKKVGTIGTFRDEMIEGMRRNGCPPEFAERVFSQIEGFGTYGFPESHAASFASLVYASCWMKCFYPDVFCAAILNSQPMGFYAPSQLVRDARDHGVDVRPVDVNASDWDCTLEETLHTSSFETHASRAPQDEEADDAETLILRSAERVSKDEVQDRPSIHPAHAARAKDIIGDRAVRLGFRQVKGLREADMAQLAALRRGGYDSVRDVWLRTGLSPAVLEILAEADVFASLGLPRRDAVWAVRGLNRAGDKDDLPLLAALNFVETEPDALLPPMPPGEEVIEDYRRLSLSLKAHPVSFLRAALTRKGILRNGELAAMTTRPSPRVRGEGGTKAG